jgi:hypothetical protein
MKNDSDGGEEMNHDEISDDYPSDSEPQAESTPPRRKGQKKARMVHTEQVPAPPTSETVRQGRGRDGTAWKITSR